MSQVAKLKELLFQPESEAITSLARRLDDVYDRAGSDALFEAHVTRSIDGALRAAEATKYESVSTALAPLVVRTVKAEITNSTDELAEALYPSMGRMVRDYVSSQIREMTESINRRLEENALMVRLTAWTSGQSPAELALAESRQLRVEDVFLIRRATGELLARWPEAAGASNIDNVFGGVLTAINDFTAEAFKSEGSSLREIDLGDSRVYLRVSPSYLLAARCKGNESAAAEKILDEEFEGLVERCRTDLDAAASNIARPAAQTGLRLQPMLFDLSARLSKRLAAIAPVRATARQGVRPLTVLLALIAIPLALWLSWGAYTRWVEAGVVSTARGIVDATGSMAGYPAELKVEPGGSALTILGLTPSADVQASLVKRISAALPGVAITDRLNALPAGTDVRPLLAEIKRDQSVFEAEVRTATDRQLRIRAANMLARAARVLEAEAAVSVGNSAALMTGLSKEAAVLSASLERPISERQSAERKSTGAGELAEASARVQALELRLSAAARDVLDTGPDGGSRTETGRDVARDDVGADRDVDNRNDILLRAERVATAAQALADRSAVKRRLAAETMALKTETTALKTETTALKAEIAALSARGLTPREQLVQFARSHAVFFNEGTGIRNPAATARMLDDLAALLERDTSRLRIVGYTDDAGAPATNLALGQARSEAVAAELTRRGVPASRLILLRRTSPENNVSPVSGAGSSNRRVEFEVGFVGEGDEG